MCRDAASNGVERWEEGKSVQRGRAGRGFYLQDRRHGAGEGDQWPVGGGGRCESGGKWASTVGMHREGRMILPTNAYAYCTERGSPGRRRHTRSSPEQAEGGRAACSISSVSGLIVSMWFKIFGTGPPRTPALICPPGRRGPSRNIVCQGWTRQGLAVVQKFTRARAHTTLRDSEAQLPVGLGQRGWRYNIRLSL